MRTTFFFALLAASLTAETSHVEASLLTNGSFENSTNDWNPSGNLGVSSSQGESDGAFALAFSIGNTASNGFISQTFSTITGVQYLLTFDFGKYSINQPLQVARLDVDVFDGTGFAGTQILDVTVSDTTPGSGDPNSTDSSDVYSSFQYSFVALGSESTIRFSDTSDPQDINGGFDAMLDNVAINASAVPEPSSAALMALCFTGISGIALIRERKRKLSVQ